MRTQNTISAAAFYDALEANEGAWSDGFAIALAMVPADGYLTVRGTKDFEFRLFTELHSMASRGASAGQFTDTYIGIGSFINEGCSVCFEYRGIAVSFGFDLESLSLSYPIPGNGTPTLHAFTEFNV